mmetsp:Transcript_1137/g.2694  ORF Transcript_1137/g.2694 Transcript_1137/m.2694 type:complete len:217 (-) Transcript_1137:2-652(-)
MVAVSVSCSFRNSARIASSTAFCTCAERWAFSSAARCMCNLSSNFWFNFSCARNSARNFCMSEGGTCCLSPALVSERPYGRLAALSFAPARAVLTKTARFTRVFVCRRPTAAPCLAPARVALPSNARFTKASARRLPTWAPALAAAEAEVSATEAWHATGSPSAPADATVATQWAQHGMPSAESSPHSAHCVRGYQSPIVYSSAKAWANTPKAKMA